MSSRAWVTLATNDSYGLGALVLAHSLRRAGSVYPAVVLITPSVTDAMRERLRGVFAEVVTVDVLDSGDAAHLALLQRPELGITFTKIHCWNLTQYEKCVFLDADTLVVQNCDELFEREELSAAPDVGWPDCFNSGVFVYKPSAETFSALINFAQERGSFDGGDQGLLNSYFSDWAHGDIGKHLPFLYNVTSAAFYSYLPALKHYGQNLKIIHFIGAAKPWLQQFNWESRSVDAPEHLKELLQLWWDLFVSQVHPQLDTTMSGVAGNLARVSPGAVGTQREALDELTRRQGWEAGNIDYMGADSFANIWAKISQTLSQPPASPPKEPTPPPKELDLPQVEPTEPKESEISSPPVIDEQKLESPVVPEQQKVIPLTEEEPNKVEAPADVVTPPGVSAPADASIQSVELAPSESSLPPKTEEMPVEAATPEPAAAPIDSESQKSQPSLPGTEVAPAETIIEASEPPTTDVAVSEDATIPVETAAIPVESSVPELPAEIPVPVVEAVLAEAQAPLEAAPLKPEEVPAPVIEASSPEILNVESKAEAVIGDVQEKKSDEVSKTVDEAPKEESPKEVPEPAPSVAPQELVTVAGVEAPAAASDVVGTPPRPEGISVAAATDSPPLANTPSKEEIPAEPAAKTTEEAAQETRL
ncbi:glycogenin-2-like isoform X3 [Battus philenor]|uniref:glycogenin-2-like isoform X3 n=1 Tax=Battus philenor TaxID=42288 RepID=UPI0035CEBD5A